MLTGEFAMHGSKAYDTSTKHLISKIEMDIKDLENDTADTKDFSNKKVEQLSDFNQYMRRQLNQRDTDVEVDKAEIQGQGCLCCW